MKSIVIDKYALQNQFNLMTFKLIMVIEKRHIGDKEEKVEKSLKFIQF